jgi:hypothetical protein
MNNDEYIIAKEKIQEIFSIINETYTHKNNIKYARHTNPNQTFNYSNKPEEWKYMILPNIEDNRYKISSWGRIYDTKLNIYKSTYLCDKGYPSTSLTYIKNISNTQKSKVIRIHRLVSQFFLEKINDKPHVNHIDLNKTNNYVYNLEWCDDSDNIKHAINNGAWGNKGGHKYFSKDDVKNILELYNNGNSLTDIAKIYNRKTAAISDIVNGKSYTDIFWDKMNIK